MLKEVPAQLQFALKGILFSLIDKCHVQQSTATHIEKPYAGLPAEAGVLNERTSEYTVAKKLKRPNCGVFTLFTLASVLISTGHADDQRDPGWSCGCFVAVSQGDCGLSCDILNN